MKRRTALFGLGLLASGSGAIATSAAVANSVQTTSQLSLVVDERLEVRAGQAFTDDGSVKSEYTDQYVPYESNQSFFNEQDDVLADIDKVELPVATVNSREQYINGDVEIQTAISLDMVSETFTFEDILEVENYGGEKKAVSISYDRNDTAYDPNGQYGEEVNLESPSNGKLTAHDVRHVYSFQVPSRFISTSTAPNQISPGVGDGQPDSSNDEPEESYIVDPGQTVQLNLKIDLSEYAFTIEPRQGIESAIDKSPSFSGTVDTVDMLDAITVNADNPS